jgi:5-enolpyruvylshikimate-3-phosphate synthase
MAMAFAPAATIFPGLCIADVGVVNKSFPKFWIEMRKLGIISEEV